MTKTELLLFRALDELWPRCAACGKRAEYRPMPPNHLGWWYCEDHIPTDLVIHGIGSAYERAPGYEAMLEIDQHLDPRQEAGA